MKIVDFNRSHMELAIKIAKAEYDEERIKVPALPVIEELPELEHFADNNLGVAAFDGNKMLGFLGAYHPQEDHFRTTNTRGTFSPIHAHGVLPQRIIQMSGTTNSYNRARIYSLLYQEAARKWVKAGIRSHAIGLYAHDLEATKSFFYNGFGLRCIDAIRSLDDMIEPLDTYQDRKTEIEYMEVPREEWTFLLEYQNALVTHLGDSPSFMKYKLFEEQDFMKGQLETTRFFAAKENGRYIAYIKIDQNAENFVTEVSSMMNISGAYCETVYRGTGIYHNLLCCLMSVLRKDGYLHLGVDCESFNPTARGFWLKYFTEYTSSVVRRIDEKAFME